MTPERTHGVQVESRSLASSSLVHYQAESPDEDCFVTSAKNLGFFFCKRMMNEVTVRCYGLEGAGGWGVGGQWGEVVDTDWTILRSNPFDNYRKRSSVVVRGKDGSIFLLVKGADSSILPYLDPKHCPHLETTKAHIERFSLEGLRTLVFASRELSAEEYAAWEAQVCIFCRVRQTCGQPLPKTVQRSRTVKCRPCARMRARPLDVPSGPTRRMPRRGRCDGHVSNRCDGHVSGQRIREQRGVDRTRF